MFGSKKDGRRRVGGSAIVIASAFLILSSALRADFAEPSRLTATGGNVSGNALSVDAANNAYVVSAADDGVRVEIIGASLRTTYEWVGEGRSASEPDAASNVRGQTFVCFSRVEEDGNRRVYLTSNAGGQFVDPVAISEGNDRSPRMSIDFEGEPVLVWTRTLENDAERIYFHRARTEKTDSIAFGRAASLHSGEEGTVHISYAREDGIYYTNNARGFFEPGGLVATAPSEEGIDTRIAADREGSIFIVYTSRGSLYLVTKERESDDFSPPRFLDSGEISKVDFRINSRDVMTVLYERGGEVYHLRGVSGLAGSPELVWAPPDTGGGAGAVVAPSGMVDRRGNTHASFLFEGDAYYTNNAGDVEADFAADVRTGEGPLEVRFQSLSSGQVQRWVWDFGDGTASTEANPVHTYALPGKYTVRLTVFNADRESSVTKEDFITVQEASNTLEIPDQIVLPGQEDVYFPVLGTHDDPLQAYQVHATFDPNIFTLKECSQEFTSVVTLDPEVWECNITEHNVEIGVIFEFQPPFTKPLLPPGRNQSLVNLIFDISNRAPQDSTTEIRLVNNTDVSSVLNVFTIKSLSQFPLLKSSTVRIHPIEFPLPTLFMRGDVDGNGNVEITDAIRILSFLFLGEEAPRCVDAADVSDSGRVDLTSAIYLLSFLFLGGSPPRVPFPNSGLDPTEDSLPGCR